MPLLCATALPAFAPDTAEARLRRLCARWDGLASPRLSPGQRAHCRRFAPAGAGLAARASRLLARLLALRALPPSAILDMDAEGRPLVRGAPGWQVAFSHSGTAAFCLVCAPGEAPPRSGGTPALDAEARGTAPPGDRAFDAPAPTQAASLRRWLLAEALFKALGAAPARWGAVAATAHEHAGERAGTWASGGAHLSWQVLAAPGHFLCVTLPGSEIPPLPLRWLPWRILA